MPETRPYGTWPSPLSPAAMAQSLRLGQPCWDTGGGTLGWLEGRSDRGVIVVQDADGSAPRDLTVDHPVRAMIGYGGGDFTLAHGHAYFVAQQGQRIYRQPLAGGPARPLTPAFGQAASPTVSPDSRWMIYVHSSDDEDCIAIASAHLPTAAESVQQRMEHLNGSWPRRLAASRTFYMQPTWHPSGSHAAWVEWDHPNMPWDGTEIVVGEIDYRHSPPQLANSRTIAGGANTSVIEPTFTPDGRSLIYLSDESGWWQVMRHDLGSGETVALTSEEAEFGGPTWPQGVRTYAVLGDGTIVATRRAASSDTLVAIAPDGTMRDLATGYTDIAHPAASPAGGVTFVGSTGATSPRVVTIDPASGEQAIRRRATGETILPSDLSTPRAVSWRTDGGETAHGLYYPPASADFASDGAPPLIVLVHGGPTSEVNARWDPAVQFLATRGYAVLQVNYRGSTGFGRAYRDALRGNWGVHDVADCRTGAEAMAQQGLADAGRLVIMGGSAGGYTVLKSLVDHPGFYRAAVCLYGVANLFTLASDTHKFEERYLDSLVGPLPEAAAIYRERSPIFHASAIKDPIAVFQGAIDPVVPREQSDSIVASLKARSVPHEYHVYEDEGHGWRKTETIEAYYKALERFLVQYVVYA